MRKRYLRFAVALNLVVFCAGCAYIFGWDIHAPGLLSQNFVEQVSPLPNRIALYLPSEVMTYISHDRGGRTGDPQTYYVGEAFAPMLVEALQSSFDEFIFLETEPTAKILKQYGIPYLVVVRIKEFKNRLGWGSHALLLTTETVVLDPDLKRLGRFETMGSSDAEKVFSKKGGPQVNLNAAVENNILGIIQYVQDSIQNGVWESRSAQV